MSTGAHQFKDERVYRRSPFCLLQWDGDVLCILNCNTFRLFRGAERYVGLLHRLTAWRSAREVASDLSADLDGIIQALERLQRMDLVVSRPATCTETNADGVGWNLIDLALQRQSAQGGFLADTLEGSPPAAFKSPPDRPFIALSASGLDDASLGDVLRRRRTQRRYSKQMVSLEELGTFLAATARVADTGHDPVVGEFTHRPYPSAGGRHPLEIYPICNRVAGLDPGAYWYHPRQHGLYSLGADAEGRDRLNQEARVAAGGLREDPALLLLVTAVFSRTMWKYQRLGLSLILKDVGALYQTMYLVATAMDLAACALGGGEESVNARWLGLDPLIESQVGCMLLGHQANT